MRLTVAPATLVMPVPGFSATVMRAVRWVKVSFGSSNSTVWSMAAMKSLAAKASCVLWSSATFTAGIRVMSVSSRGHHADTVIGSRLVQ